MNTDPIKTEDLYLRLRRRDVDEETARQLTMSSAHPPGKSGMNAPAYEMWSRAELIAEARGMGVSYPSRLERDELIREIDRAHGHR